MRSGPTLVLLLAVLAGLCAGGLTYLAGQRWPVAVLAGGAAGAAALRLFDKLIS